MRRVLAMLAIVCALPLILPASDFDWLVREFARESGSKPMHLPFFGVLRFALNVAQPAGTSELHLAIFENTSVPYTRFGDLTDAVAGAAWKPIIRVRSRSGESTNIYSQSEGNHLRLLIATLDGREATFVQVRIKPEELMKFVDEHRGRCRISLAGAAGSRNR